MLSAWEIRRSQDTRFGASGRKESPAIMVFIIFVILSSYYRNCKTTDEENWVRQENKKQSHFFFCKVFILHCMSRALKNKSLNVSTWA